MSMEDDPTYIVAAAMHDSMRDAEEPAFADLEDEERANFMAVALVAMDVHFEWLKSQGYRIAPPGTMLRPKSDGDARAMILAGQEWLKQPEHAAARRKKLVAGPKLIMPSRLQ